MDWQQAEGQLVKVDTTAKLKQEINCFLSNFYIQFSGFQCAPKVWSCLTPITAAKKLSFTCLKAARKMDWQPAGGQLVKVDTAAKLKREQVLYCALKSALFCGGSGGGGAVSAGSISYLAGKKVFSKLSFYSFISLLSSSLGKRLGSCQPSKLRNADCDISG